MYLLCFIFVDTAFLLCGAELRGWNQLHGTWESTNKQRYTVHNNNNNKIKKTAKNRYSGRFNKLIKPQWLANSHFPRLVQGWFFTQLCWRLIISGGFTFGEEDATFPNHVTFLRRLRPSLGWFQPISMHRCSFNLWNDNDIVYAI